ncbi:hypothetical protein GCM10022419_008140 [Nonomuraea rosea]|uniref:Uncharacterized protein n=1 Tax=Nonomuraea rosea TaxID=638574 RepID=A0ABP6VCF7_9ACTN
MTADQKRLSAQRAIAADISWARTPNRAERTEAGRKASPMSLDYWIAKIRTEGIVREQDIPAAARNAHRAHMRGMSLKAAARRKRRS